MKKMIVLMMLLSIAFTNKATADKTTDSNETNMIDLDIRNVKNDYDRSLCFPIIEAVCYSTTKQVEVTLYDIGDAEVYIVNSQNQVVSSATVQTDVLTIVNLNINGGQGTYYIVVMSDKWYAEGKFTL